MNLPKFALHHKPIVLGIALLLFAAGLNTFLNAPRREDPEFTIREAVVTTEWPGASARQVERLISDKVEKAAANIKQVRRVQSRSYFGRSVVQVSALNDLDDVAPVWTKLRAEMKLLEPDLPQTALSPEVDDNFGDTAALVLAIYQDPAKAAEQPYTPRQMEIFAQRLRDRLMDLRPMVERSDGRMVPITTDPAYVARLDTYGVQPEVIYLETDAVLWSQLQIKSDLLQRILSERNVIAPAGILDTRDYRVNSRISGNFDAVREINSVVVDRIGEARDTAAATRPSGRPPETFDLPVNLKDLNIAVKRDYRDPPTAIVRYGDPQQSMPAVVLSFTMKPGQNVSWLGDSVDWLLETANDTFLPPDIRVATVSDPPRFVEKKISDVVDNMLEAIILVLIILTLLAGWRVAVVTACSVPLIALTALALMRFWDVQIEQISLAALIVSLGLLVDNAIVTGENSARFLKQGLAREEAVTEGCNSVGTSLLWSSFTTISVFIPMAFVLPGDIGEYVFSLPVVVTLTLLVSWLCAMTVTPILNYYILQPTAGLPIVLVFKWIAAKLGIKAARESTGADKSKKSLFAALSRLAIRLRVATIVVPFALLFASFMLPVPSSFFPDSDRPQFVVDIWLPETASIYRTDEVTRQVESLMRRLSRISWQDGAWVETVDEAGNPFERLDTMVAYVGVGGPRFYAGVDPKPNAPHYALLTVNANDPEGVQDFIADVRRAAWTGIGTPGESDYLPPIAGARVVPNPLVMGTPVPSPIQYRLSGPRLADEAVLRHFGLKLKNALKDSGMAWDVHDSWGVYGLQLNINVNAVDANLAGVTNTTIARTLNTYFSGQHLTRYREGDREIPVILRLPRDQRQSLKTVNAAFVEGYDRKVPLNAIADFEVRYEPTLLTRYQRERSIWIQGRPEPGIQAREIIAALEPRVRELEKEMPPGYHIQNGGIDEEAVRGERANTVALGIGMALVILCLVLQYNSAVKPLLILLTVPLSIIGGLLGLWLRGIPFGFMETLGFLALFGTVLNAAILLIDYTQQLIGEKLKAREGLAAEGERSYCGLTRDAFRAALVEASQVRLLPIFMTTATTVAGLTSLMFGGGPLFKGLATVFAVGLIVGSAITLFVLPALMALFVENFRFSLVKPGE